jgi:hypothetical protein
MNLHDYLHLRDQLVTLGYSDEIEWAQTVQPVINADIFWREFAWVVLNSGMKNQVAAGIWQRVRPTVENGGSAAEVFGHQGKAAAINAVYERRGERLAEYLAAADKLAYLRSLPWIGHITCYHLAKNFGHDVAKPDRHLVRIAGAEGVDALCQRLACASGDRVATVDVVIWRAANLRLI